MNKIINLKKKGTSNSKLEKTDLCVASQKTPP